MKYLLLICGDESAAAHADDGCGGWIEEMAGRGALAATGGLRPPAEAKTVRVRRRKLLLADGPFAETKEQLAGYYLVEAKDMAEAAKLAAGIPNARDGVIEVRAINSMARAY